MARSAAERYLVAAFVFLDAAIWLGVGLKNGFACLLAFVLTFQAVRLYQLRSSVRGRRASRRRERPSRYAPSHEETDGPLPTPRPTASAGGRSQPSGHVYDGGREETARPLPSEANW